MEQKLLLVDGNSLLYRAYYAFSGGGVNLSYEGKPTHATYGFLNMLVRALEDIRPTHLAVCFDVRGKTFRHDLYDGYKATRKPTPDDLVGQMTDTKEILGKLGIPVLQKQGFEADDLIGTLSVQSKIPAVILTADRDLFQLIGDGVELHLTKSGVTTLDRWNEARVRDEIGITPKQMIDLKALVGDTSDNIPGCRGLGEKGSLALIREWGNIENLYGNLDSLRDVVRAKLIESQDNVYKSLALGRINTEVPLEGVAELTLKFPFPASARQAFEKRGFKTLLNKKSIWETQSESGILEKNVPIQIVKDLEELQVLIKRIANWSIIAVQKDQEFVRVYNKQEEYRIRILANLLEGGLDYYEILTQLKPIFEGKIELVVWDSKALAEELKPLGIMLSHVKLDVKIAKHLLTSRTDLVEPDNLMEINYFEKLSDFGLLELYENIELPLVDILIDLQQNGIQINLEALEKTAQEFNMELASLSAEIYEQAGQVFNINSPQQLGEILFKKLGLTAIEKTKTGYSTNEEVLARLSPLHPIIPPIQRFRKAQKLSSTYVQGYKKLADENGFVYTKFNNTATVTGRLSSSEPNLQNIPARSEEARRIRQLFKSRFEGGKLLCADYSQIELRILAHLSGDELMCEAFRSGRDIHTETATRIFNSEKEVTSAERNMAKAVNFGIIYGMSSFGLSESLGIKPTEASRFIERYFAQFPKIKKFLDSCTEQAIQYGYAVTLMGRRRYLPELSSRNPHQVKFAHRAAMNMPMQGSAADIIKKAMISIHKRMRAEGFRSLMLAQIHDELVFDCVSEEIDRLSTLVKDEMEGAINLLVPLHVDVEARETL